MNISRFSETDLANRLGKIGRLRRAVYALTCAERLFPLYQMYSERAGQGNPHILRSTLDQLWNSALQRQAISKSHFLDEYEFMIPGDELQRDKRTPLDPLAENAIAALAYACKCFISDEVENSVWASVQGYEAADYIAHTLGNMKFGDRKAEDDIANSTYVQGELYRQQRDLAQLESISPDEEGIEKLANELRSRATLEGMLQFSQINNF